MVAIRHRPSDVIDWVRSLSAEKWTTANIRKLNFRGAEIGVQRFLDSRRYLLEMQYGYYAGDPGPIQLESKYVLDYARHSGAGRASASLPYGLWLSQGVNYKKYADGRSYWLLDARLMRRFGSFELSLDCSNLLDTHFQEIRGIDMPGRWLSARLKWNP